MPMLGYSCCVSHWNKPVATPNNGSVLRMKKGLGRCQFFSMSSYSYYRWTLTWRFNLLLQMDKGKISLRPSRCFRWTTCIQKTCCIRTSQLTLSNSLFKSQSKLHRSDRMPLYVALLLPAHLLRWHANDSQCYHPEWHGCDWQDCGQGKKIYIYL